MKKWRIGAVVIVLLFWLLASLRIHNDILLPTPWAVLVFMVRQLRQASTYRALFATLGRFFIGLALSAALALFLASLSFFYQRLGALIRSWILILKTIPNITFIFMALIWLGKDKSVLLIVVLVLLPIFYEALLQGYESLDESLHSVLRLYTENPWEQFRFVYCYTLRPYFFTALMTAFGLGIKVLVMAELLNSIQSGIGYELSYARLNLDTTQIMAWSIWMILITALFEGLSRALKKRSWITP